jgi:hypothetical protein
MRFDNVDLIWTSAHLPNQNADNPCSMDDRHLMSSQVAAGTAFILLRSDGYPVSTQTHDTGSAPPGTCRESLDGMYLWEFADDSIVAHALHVGPRLFQRASGTDATRRPLPSRLAQPVR